MLDNKLIVELQEYVDLHISKPNPEVVYSSSLSEDIIFYEKSPHYELEDFIKKNRKPIFI